MKLITLNTWGGRLLYEPLVKFLAAHSGDTDIFCLQEVFNNADNLRRVHEVARPNLFSDIAGVLPGFKGFFADRQDNEEGLAIFVRNGLEISKTGDVFVYKDRNTMIGDDGTTIGVNIQYLEVIENKKKGMIINFHGMWTGKGKGDTPERIQQSTNIKKFLDSVNGPKLLCGDFNLLPNIESMRILERNMKNLITEYNIVSTRNVYYRNGDGKTKFADYILVSNDIKIEDFKVLEDIVSDHQPLSLEFSF